MVTQHKNLKQLNTFGIDVKAHAYAEVHTAEDAQNLIEKNYFKSPFLILGGGSNMLFTRDFEGLVVRNRISGLEVVAASSDYILLRIGAGENWHETVLKCVENNWCGIENLSLIPGCVGAAPIQNIGAYGVEIKDVLEQVHFIDLSTGEQKVLSHAECQFGYRNSIFKSTLKNKVLITAVDLRLSKTPNPNLKLDYGAIKDELANMGVSKPSIKDVSNAVISIRQSKLPDPAELGNSGSFFKNPIIPNAQFEQLVVQHPDIRSYKVDKNHVKLAAGWLIEQCGWKGKRVGNTGSHAKQALVLVNYGNATGQEVKELAFTIIESVRDTFGVNLEPEVNII